MQDGKETAEGKKERKCCSCNTNEQRHRHVCDIIVWCTRKEEEKNNSQEDTANAKHDIDDDKWEEKEGRKKLGSNKWLTKLIECHFEDHFRPALTFISLKQSHSWGRWCSIMRHKVFIWDSHHNNAAWLNWLFPLAGIREREVYIKNYGQRSLKHVLMMEPLTLKSTSHTKDVLSN